MNEIWKDIPGYEGEYQVSNYGNVRSLKRGMPGKVLRQLKSGPQNRLYVCLRKPGERKNHYVHRLVAESFCEKKDGADVVNHLDYNPYNNHYKNLEWVTQAENTRYSIHRMRKPYRKCRPTNTGEKYITLQTVYGRTFYRVTIDSVRAYKECKTLEEAIKYRDKMLNDGANFRLERAKGKPFYSDWDIEEIAMAKESGMTVNQICDKFDLSRTTYFSKMKEYERSGKNG